MNNEAIYAESFFRKINSPSIGLNARGEKRKTTFMLNSDQIVLMFISCRVQFNNFLIHPSGFLRK